MNPESFQNNFCLEADLPQDARFPLTPALSPVEREKRPQLLGEPTAESNPVAGKFREDIQQLSPLPAGEGQGEGKPADFLDKRLSRAQSQNHEAREATNVKWGFLTRHDHHALLGVCVFYYWLRAVRDKAPDPRMEQRNYSKKQFC